MEFELKQNSVEQSKGVFSTVKTIFAKTSICIPNKSL